MNLLINKIKEVKPAQWFYGGAITLFALAHVLIYALMPYTCDDYWYMTPIADYCRGIDTSFPAEGLWECWTSHYRNDNIRLANIIFTLTLLLPKVIPSIISGLLVGVMLWASAKLASLRSHNPLMMMLLVLMLSFMLPWYEEMFTQCFAFNYIWSSALALWLAYLFFIRSQQPNVVVSGMLGLLMGAWHEGIAGPLLVGFVTYLILNRKAVSRKRIAMIIALVVGLIWLASAPGLQANVAYKTNELQLSAVVNKLLLYHVPLLILLLSMLVASIKRDTRKMLLDPLFLSFVAISLVGVALNMITNVGVRTGWMGYLFGIISVLYLWKNMREARYGRGKSLFKRIATVAIAIFLLVHYAVVIYYTTKIKNETQYVLSQYEKSPDGLVFADVTYDYQVSPLAWKKPYFESFTYNLITLWIDRYYADKNKHLRVIPTCLRDVENLDAVKVKGDNPFMIYNGHLFAPIKDDEKMKESIYEIDFGPTKKILSCSNFVFTTKSGNKYYFSFPQRATVHHWIGEIKEMNKIEAR